MGNISKTFMVSALGLVIAGCGGTTPDIAAPVTTQAETPRWFDQASPETIAGYFEAKCLNYGFQSETPQLASCIEVTEGAARSLARFAIEN